MDVAGAQAFADPTVSNEVFQSAAWYDCMGRQVAQAMQGADGSFVPNLAACCCNSVPPQTLLSFFAHDSRGNRTLTVDPKGNSVLAVYDGASRRLQSIQLLRQSGQGANGPLPGSTFLPGAGSVIVTSTVYDANSRLTQLIDDRGGVTSYLYGTLDRQTQMVFHDGSTRTNTYDTASDVTTYTDENGSILNNTFDPLGRKTAVSITPATNVLGTTAQSFQFDGLSRLTFAQDLVGTNYANVSQFYDSLGRSVEEAQSYDTTNTANITNNAFTSYPVTQFTYPGTGTAARQITNTYDVLYRRTEVQDTGSGTNFIATWQFFGPSRVAEVSLANGLAQTFMNNARTHAAVQAGVPNPVWGTPSSDRLGYDGAGRMIAKRFIPSATDSTTQKKGSSLIIDAR